MTLAQDLGRGNIAARQSRVRLQEVRSLVLRPCTVLAVRKQLVSYSMLVLQHDLVSWSQAGAIHVEEVSPIGKILTVNPTF